MDLTHAALAKINIADGQRFVHQQDLRVHADSDGEREAYGHAARIGLDRLEHEVADFGEIFDLLEARIDLLLRKTEDRAIHVDAVASTELRIEARAQLQ